MKLIFCRECNDVIRLLREPRSCACGRCEGHYTNEVDAVVTGPAVHLAIGNGSLVSALTKLGWYGPEKDRGFYRDNCAVLCWARPGTGPGNPHTTCPKDEAMP